MNHLLRRSFLLAPGLLLAAVFFPAAGAGAVPVPAAAKAATHSQHLRERIDALFKRRLKPEPLPVTLPNPFLVVSGGINGKRPDGTESDPATGDDRDAHVGAPDPKPAEETPPASDTEALAHYMATLKIGGALQLNGRPQLIINQSPRKEGDLIFLDNKDSMIYLRVIRITPFELTLGFKEVEQTVRLKN